MRKEQAIAVEPALLTKHVQSPQRSSTALDQTVTGPSSNTSA